MSKGDKITVVISTADGSVARTVEASKAGRNVTQRVATRQKVAWLDVVERARTGRETGRRLSVRMASVIAVLEERVDD